MTTRFFIFGLCSILLLPLLCISLSQLKNAEVHTVGKESLFSHKVLQPSECPFRQAGKHSLQPETGNMFFHGGKQRKGIYAECGDRIFNKLIGGVLDIYERRNISLGNWDSWSFMEFMYKKMTMLAWSECIVFGPLTSKDKAVDTKTLTACSP